MDDVCNMYNYADDNTLLNTDHRIDSLVAKLENSTMVATHWFEINGMKWNKPKFQAMMLNKHPDLNNISLNVNCTNFPLKSCVKSLSVFGACKLHMQAHIEATERYSQNITVPEMRLSNETVLCICILKF